MRISDWSSDVCSSDLEADIRPQQPEPAVDVGDERLQEAIDDIEVVQGTKLPAGNKGMPRGAAGELGRAPRRRRRRGWRRRETESGPPARGGWSGRLADPEPRDLVVAAGACDACEALRACWNAPMRLFAALTWSSRPCVFAVRGNHRF